MTGLTVVAHRVDLTGDPAPGKIRRAALDDSDELVTRDAGVRVVAPRQLDIGIADPRQENANERFAWRWGGDCDLAKREFSIFQPESLHQGLC